MCKSHPGGTGFEGMKGSWRATGALHCERPWKAIGKGATSVAIDGPGLERVMHRSRGLSPSREPMRGYWWSLITVEVNNVLEMPVPCDDHQEQQHQWGTGSWSLEDKLCATKGRTEEVTQALGGAQKIVSWIPDIGHLEFEFCFWLWLFPDMFPSWRKKVF